MNYAFLECNNCKSNQDLAVTKKLIYDYYDNMIYLFGLVIIVYGLVIIFYYLKKNNFDLLSDNINSIFPYFIILLLIFYNFYKIKSLF